MLNVLDSSLTSQNARTVPPFFQGSFLSGWESGRVLADRAQNGRVYGFEDPGIASIFLQADELTVGGR